MTRQEIGCSLHTDGGSVKYSHDQANRLSAMTDWNGRNTIFSYDNVGRRIGLSLPNGTKASYSYDLSSRLTDYLFNCNKTSKPQALQTLTTNSYF